MKHKSISQRMDRAKSFNAKSEVLSDWSKAWESETMGLIRQLERAIQHIDHGSLCISTGQLKTVLQKHFDALPNILSKALEFSESHKSRNIEETEDHSQLEGVGHSIMDQNEPQETPHEITHLKEPALKTQSMPEGYISIKEWSLKNGRGPKAAQKIMWRNPSWIPSAIKVRNPHGGVDIWAVPEDTLWPSSD